MNTPVLSFESLQNAEGLNHSVTTLTFERIGKFMNMAQKEAYRKKAIQEIRRALKTSKDF